MNRNTVTIDTPPHSTGAFDIDYRYMSYSGANFLMADLARIEDIEVIRERNANYHVFAL